MYIQQHFFVYILGGQPTERLSWAVLKTENINLTDTGADSGAESAEYLLSSFY